MTRRFSQFHGCSEDKTGIHKNLESKNLSSKKVNKPITNRINWILVPKKKQICQSKLISKLPSCKQCWSTRTFSPRYQWSYKGLQSEHIDLPGTAGTCRMPRLDPWCFIAALSGDEQQLVLNLNYSKGYSQTQQSHKVSQFPGFLREKNWGKPMKTSKFGHKSTRRQGR